MSNDPNMVAGLLNGVRTKAVLSGLIRDYLIEKVIKPMAEELPQRFAYILPKLHELTGAATESPGVIATGFRLPKDRNTQNQFTSGSPKAPSLTL